MKLRAFFKEVKSYFYLLLSANMHNRAHPRHYRSEYVRGYLHRKRCVQPSRLVFATFLTGYNQ